MVVSGRLRLCALGFLVSAGLLACDATDPAALVSYSIVVASSGAARSAPFGGTYQFFLGGQRITRDLTGNGTSTVIFDAQEIEFVRLHGASTDSLYSLIISRDGEVIFESRAVAGGQSILYHSKAMPGGARQP